MSEVTIASLAMEIDVRSADPATGKLENLKKLAADIEAQFGRTGRSISESAAVQATAAGRAEQSMKSLVSVWGQARDSLGRFTAVDGSFRHSQEATAMMLLRNAQAQAALVKEQDAAARAVQRLTSSYDPLAGEVLKVNRQLAEAERLFSKGAISVDQYGAVADGLRQKLANLETAQATGVKSSKALQMATLNLGRQFTDIGVQLAGGQNPFLVLIQQTPQIIDGFEVAKMQGLSFKAVLAGIGTTIAPFLPALIAIGTVAGVAFGGAALAARALNQDNKNLAASLGLTEKQMDRLKAKGIETGVTIGDVFRGTFNYIAGAVKPILDPVKKWFGELFDDITKGSIGTIKAIVGGFMGAFASVKAIWSDFPAVMGDLFISGVNLAIGAIEKLLNSTTAGINALIEKANAVSAKVNGPQISLLNGFSLGRATNAYEGAADKAGERAGKAFADGMKRGAAAVDAVGAGVSASVLKAAQDRLKKAAGDAEKATKGHTEAIKANEVAIVGLGDNTFEFTRDLERQVATMGQSRETQMELAYQTARLGATTDDQVERLDRAYAAWKAQNRVLTDAEKVQKAVDAQQRDNIKTYADANKGLDEHKRSLEEVSWAYERAFRSAGDFFGAVASGDVGGSIGGLSNLLKSASKLSSGGLSDALGKAGKYLGPVGEAVSAVTGVLGIIGQKSAEKAQAKLDALSRGVDDLRAANVTSSASIKGALDEANKAWNADLEYTSQMVTSLRSIDSQIGSLAVAVSNSITTGNLLSTSGLGLGTSGSGSGGLLGAVGALLFGNTKTSTTLLDQGLAFNPGTYAQGVTGSTYADLATTKTRSLLGVAYSTKVSNSTVSGSLNGELLSQVNAVIKALGDGVLSAASVFGSEAAKAAESALGSAVVDLGKLSLKDLKPDEIAAVLQATFDKVGDQLAAAGVPGLDKLGQVGEGAFETLTRVAREYQVVDVALASIGKTFGAVGLESLAARDGLVQLLGGVEEFSSKTGFFAANFLTDAERLAPIQKAVNDNLAAYGLSAASTRDQFKSLVLAQDLTTESGRNAYAALLNIAPAFDKVAKASEAATAAADELAKQTADQQRQEAEAKIAKAKEVADAQASIQDRIDALTMTSAELMYAGRRKELDAADALDASLGPLLVKLYGLEDAASAAAKAAEEAAAAEALREEAVQRSLAFQQTNIGLMRQLMAMDDAVTGGNSALLAMREDELAKLDDTGKYLQKIIWARQDEQKIIDANTAALEKENARRAELTNRQTAIQDEIDKLTLSSSDLLLKTRAKERAEAVAFDASLGPLLDSLYALQDAASATAAANEAAAAAAAAAAEEAQRAAELYSSRMSKVADLLTASGQNTLATLFQRSQELSRIVDPVSRALQLQIYAAQDLADQIGAARDTLTASYERESGAIEAFRDKLVGVGDSLRDYSASLGSTLSGSASASSQRAQAEAAFRDIVTRYQQGDVSLAGQIPALGEAFARASQAASKDQLSYLRDIAYIKAETDQAASKVDSQVTIAAQQLDQLKAQVSGLINVEAATMTVAQAVTNLTDLVRQTTYGQDARAQAIQDQINGMQSPFSLIWTLLGSKAALAAGLPQYTGANDNIPGFAAGGVFTNGIVSQPTMFNMAQMGEAGSEAIVPLVRGPEGLGVRMSGGGNAEMVAELRALRKEVAELKAAQIQTAINTGRQVRLAERWDGDGLPPERTAA